MTDFIALRMGSLGEIRNNTCTIPRSSYSRIHRQVDWDPMLYNHVIHYVMLSKRFTCAVTTEGRSHDS